jgi:hypothetical protein
MPRFYFHITSPDVFIPDSKGVELDSLSAAHRFLQKITDDALPLHEEEPPCRRWSMRIADQDGRTLLAVLHPFRREPTRTVSATSVGSAARLTEASAWRA